MIRNTGSSRARRFAALAALGVAVAIVVPLYAFGGGDKPVKKASATLLNASGAEVGTVELKQEHGYVSVTASFDVLPVGFHGFHVHTTGVCTAPGFTSANGHFNPAAVNHGGHAGDMPVLLVKSDGTAEESFETDSFALDDLFDADGSAIIVHANADNYANIPAIYGPANAATLSTGDAGSRYACGVVESKKG